MIFYGECNILDKIVAWEEFYENLGEIKVVVIKLSWLENEAYGLEGGMRYLFSVWQENALVASSKGQPGS